MLSFYIFASALFYMVTGQSFRTTPAAVASTNSSFVQYVSSVSGFDAPKILPVTVNNYDWWYFDGVGEDPSYSFQAALYFAPNTSLPLDGNTVNQTLFATLRIWAPELDPVGGVLGGEGFATEALTLELGDGIFGQWTGTNLSFYVAPDLSTATVEMDRFGPAALSGTIALRSRAPAHLPCSLNEPGSTMAILPGVGWANAIPDASATVNVTVGLLGNERVEFDVIGYHDKNWGSEPFDSAVDSWFWGHGRLGQYSLVWFDAITTTGENYVSGYVAKHGTVLSAGCQKANIVVRPIGTNDTYPPTLATGTSSIYRIVADAGSDGILEVIANGTYLRTQTGTYQNYAGTLTGGIRGSLTNITGSAFFEEFLLV